MATSTTRTIIGTWLAACFLAAPAVPVLAQTRVVAPVEGFSAPIAPASGVQMDARDVVSPISFAALPSAPAVSFSRLAAPAPGAISAMPALTAHAASAPSVTAAMTDREAAPTAIVPARAAASNGSRILHTQPQSAREAAAIATVEGGIAGWTARASQTLDAAPTFAAASQGTGSLERSSAQSTAERPAHETPAPEAPAPSKFKKFFSWAGPIMALTTLVLGIDAATKFYAVHHMFHLFHEVAWRKPLILALVPYIIFTAYKARSTLPYDRRLQTWSIKKVFHGGNGFYGYLGFFPGATVSGMNTMIKDHPSLRAAVRFYDVAIALMLGGMLGNGIDTLRIGGAMDWIPLGRSLMNFADVGVLIGLSYFQASSTFFLKAATAHKAGKPLFYNNAWFLGIPLAGVFIAWAFGSASGGGALDLAMKNVGFLYLMAFSMLIGAGRFIGAVVVNGFAKRFVAEEGVRLAAPSAKN